MTIGAMRPDQNENCWCRGGRWDAADPLPAWSGLRPRPLQGGQAALLNVLPVRWPGPRPHVPAAALGLGRVLSLVQSILLVLWLVGGVQF